MYLVADFVELKKKRSSPAAASIAAADAMLIFRKVSASLSGLLHTYDLRNIIFAEFAEYDHSARCLPPYQVYYSRP